MQRFCKCAHFAYGVLWLFPISCTIGAAIEISTEISIAVRTALQTTASYWKLLPLLLKDAVCGTVSQELSKPELITDAAPGLCTLMSAVAAFRVRPVSCPKIGEGRTVRNWVHLIVRLYGKKFKGERHMFPLH